MEYLSYILGSIRKYRFCPNDYLDEAKRWRPVLDKAMEKDGLVERIMEKDGLVERLTRKDGLVERLTMKDGLVERLTRKDGLVERLTMKDGLVERLTRKDGIIESVIYLIRDEKILDKMIKLADKFSEIFQHAVIIGGIVFLIWVFSQHDDNDVEDGCCSGMRRTSLPGLLSLLYNDPSPRRVGMSARESVIWIHDKPLARPPFLPYEVFQVNRLHVPPEPPFLPLRGQFARALNGCMLSRMRNG